MMKPFNIELMFDIIGSRCYAYIYIFQLRRKMLIYTIVYSIIDIMSQDKNTLAIQTKINSSSFSSHKTRKMLFDNFFVLRLFFFYNGEKQK